MADLKSWLANNSQALLGLSAGLLGGRNPQEQVAGGMKGLTDAMQNNRTYAMLSEKDPELAEAMKAGAITGAQAFNAYYQKRTAAEKPGSLSFETLPDGTFGTFNDKTGAFDKLGLAPKTQEPSKPSFQQLDDGTYGFADAGSGTFTTLGSAPKPNEDATKAPSGFRFTDPSRTRLEPIPGGPGEQISAEQAARIGMADTFLKRAPDLRTKIAAGETTGVIDRAAAGYGVGNQGQVYQDLQSGVDALIRFMTGAGMNYAEAELYADRYMPTYRDTAHTATAKLDRLVEELKSARSVVMRGRGDLGSPPGNVDDLLKKYGGM